MLINQVDNHVHMHLVAHTVDISGLLSTVTAYAAAIHVRRMADIVYANRLYTAYRLNMLSLVLLYTDG